MAPSMCVGAPGQPLQTAHTPSHPQTNPTPPQPSALPSLLPALVPNLSDSNVKVPLAVCDVLARLAGFEGAAATLGDLASLAPGLAELLGAAKPNVRDAAEGAALALMSVTPPQDLLHAVFACAFSPKVKNWRVRCGALTLWAGQVWGGRVRRGPPRRRPHRG